MYVCMYVCVRGQRVRWECNVSLVYVRAYKLVCVLFGVGACVCMYVCVRGQRVRWECNVSLCVCEGVYACLCVIWCYLGACVCMYVCMCVRAVRESGGNVMCP